MTEEIKKIKKNQLDTENPYKPTGKSKKARHRLNAVNQEIEAIKKQLDNARNALITIIMTVPKQAFSKIKGIDEQESKQSWEWLNKKGYINKNGKEVKWGQVYY